jgi:hypothetical protein
MSTRQASSASSISSFWPLWGWPIALGVLSALGLLSALVGDGLWDWASWLALGLPVAVCGWFGLRRER